LIVSWVLLGPGCAANFLFMPDLVKP